MAKSLYKIRIRGPEYEDDYSKPWYIDYVGEEFEVIAESPEGKPEHVCVDTRHLGKKGPYSECENVPWHAYNRVTHLRDKKKRKECHTANVDHKPNNKYSDWMLGHKMVPV